jgi:hypothetical protein
MALIASPVQMHHRLADQAGAWSGIPQTATPRLERVQLIKVYTFRPARIL